MQTGIELLERRKVEGITSRLGENFFSRIGENLQHRKSGKTDTRIQSNRLHSLEKKEFHNELCVQLKQGSFDVRNNFVSKFYKCLKNHPDYKGDLTFNKDMNINKIVSLIQDKLESLFPEDSEVIIDIDDYDTKDVMVAAYVAHDMFCSQMSMPLRWLLQLKNENEKLYTIVRNVISLVKGKFGIPDFEEGFTEQAKEMFFSDLIDIEDIEDLKWNLPGFAEICSESEIEGWKMHYNGKFIKKIKSKDGKGYLFMNEVKDIYRMIDEDWLMNQINTYSPRNELYKELLEWAKKGMKLYNNHHDISIHDLIFVSRDEYEEGTPVTALDFLKFEWDFRCPFWEQGVELCLNDYAGQVGVIETREHVILKENEHINKHGEKFSSFGKELEEWFDFGTSVYYGKIWDWEKR